MKSLATMRELCSDSPLLKTPRKDDKSGLFGYYLTVGEIKQIYYDNGFSRRARTTIPSHIEAWAYTGQVGYDEDADLTNDSTVIWWPCQTDQTAMTMAAERILADPDKLVMVPPTVIFGGE